MSNHITRKLSVVGLAVSSFAVNVTITQTNKGILQHECKQFRSVAISIAVSLKNKATIWYKALYIHLIMIHTCTLYVNNVLLIILYTQLHMYKCLVCQLL